MKPRAYYFSDGHYAEILRGLFLDLNKPEAFVQLVGGPRSGKSALCETLALYMRRKGYDVVLIDYQIDSPEMLRGVLAQKYDLPSINNISRQLEEVLLSQSEKPKILIFDDAQQLSDVTLLEIQRLSEIQANSKRLLNVMLCGDLELEQRLQSKKQLKPLLLNVTRKCLLLPMNREMIAQFFASYAAENDCSGLQLSAEALDLYFKCSKGFPGAVVQIAQSLVNDSVGKHAHRVISKLDFAALVNETEVQQALPPAVGFDLTQLKIIAPIAALFVLAVLGLSYQLIVGSGEGAIQNDSEVAVTEQSLQNQSSPFVETAAEEVDGAEITAGQAVAGLESSAIVEQIMPTLLRPASVFSLDDEEPEQTEIEADNQLSQLAAQDSDQAVQEPVSDSNLALVTAAELGVTPEIIEDVEIELAPISEDQAAESLASIEPVSEISTQGIPTPSIGGGSIDTAEVIEAIAPPLSERSIETDDRILANEDSTLLADAELIEQPSKEVSSLELEVGTETEAGEQREPAISIAATATIEEPPTQSLSELESVDDTAPNSDADNAVQVNAISAATVAENAETAIENNSLRQRVDGWVAAWEAQELDAYFSSYGENFEPRYESSVSRWRASRTRVIGNAEWIRLNLSEYEIIEQTSASAEVHFWLDYESPTYSDSTKKKLVLSKSSGVWMIAEEINLQVRS